MTKYGDTLEISNSEIQAYLDCGRRWWLTYHRGLRPVEEKPTGPLAIGSRIHLALEHGYSTPGREEAALKILAESIAEDYPKAVELGLEKEFLSEAELCLAVLEGFFQWASEEGLDAGWEVIEHERIVKTPPINIKGQDVILKGKLDQIVRDERTGQQWMRDWKGQPLDGIVHTPFGPREMRELDEGSWVVGGDGRPTKVTAVQDLGPVPCYKVSFSDGGELEVTSEHLWKLIGNGSRPGGLLTTKEMLELGVDDLSKRSQPTKRWQIPIVEPIWQRPAELPVDSYLLGLFLGDGHFRRGSGRASICSSDDEILEYAERYCKHPRKKDPRSNAYTVVLSDDIRNELTNLGLEGHLSYTKFIPSSYFSGSIQQRAHLLQGLMDTDGSCQKTGRRPNAQSSFATTSPYLRDGLIRLVRTLGGTAKFNSTLVGRIDGIAKADYWAVTVSISRCPFRLHRKASAWTPVKVERKVMSIEPSGLKDSRCIKVEAADGLYIAGWDYVVTHNTTVTLKLSMLPFGPQLKTYLLLLQMTEPEAQVNGGVFVFLKKNKRTARAEPPFYMQETLFVSTTQRENFWAATVGVLDRIVETTVSLEQDGDHHALVPARPTRDCSWRCPFVLCCDMFDDGSDVERYLEANYKVTDPYEYYGLETEKETTE